MLDFFPVVGCYWMCRAFLNLDFDIKKSKVSKFEKSITTFKCNT
jgi:hypothetical protein